MVSIEQTILSTYLQADMQLNDQATKAIRMYELQEESFNEHYHKIIVKTINHLQAESKPVYAEYVAEVMQNNGTYNQSIYMQILSANPVTPIAFKTYFEQLQGHGMKSKHWDI